MTPAPLPSDPLASVESDLAAIDSVPLSERAQIFGRIHDTIVRVLDGTVDRPSSPPGSPDRAGGSAAHPAASSGGGR